MAAGYTGNNNPAVYGNQPGTHNYLNSQEWSDFMLTKPSVFPNLIQRYGIQDLGIRSMLKMIPGFSTSSDGAEIRRHLEADFIRGLVFVGAQGGGSAGDAVQLTVQNGNIGVISQTAPYIDAGNAALDEDRIIPRELDIVQFANGVYAIVTEVDEAYGTFTVIPNDETEAVPATTTDVGIAITGSLAEEGSSPRESVSSRFIYYENYMTHVRDDWKVSTRAAGEPIWVKVPDKNGKLTDKWYAKGAADTYHRMMGYVDTMFLDGKPLTNPAIAALGGKFRTIQRGLGLIQTIEDAGNNQGYTKDAMQLDDLANLNFQFDANKAPTDHIVLADIHFRKDFSTLLAGGDGTIMGAANSPGRLVFNTFNGKEKQGLNLDMDYLTYMGYNYTVKQMQAFSDPNSLGAVNKYKGIGVFIPVGQTVMYNYNDSKTKVNVPTVQIVEKETDLGITGYSEWMTGHAPKFGINTSGKQELNFHYEYSGMLETFAINRFGLMTDGLSS